MVSKIIIFILLSLSAAAQDFEPDRRPEQSSFMCEFSDGTVTDHSGQASSYTLYGSPSSTQLTPVLTMSGGAGVYLGLSANDKYYTAPCTQMMWVRVQDVSRAYMVYSSHTSFSGAAASGSNSLYHDVSDNNFYFIGEVGTSGSLYYSTSISSSTMHARWVHLAATFDGSIARFYLNGSQVYSLTRSSAVFRDATIRDFVFGGATDRNNAHGSVSQFDSVRFFPIVKSASEIMTVYQSGRTGQGDNQP